MLSKYLKGRSGGGLHWSLTLFHSEGKGEDGLIRPRRAIGIMWPKAAEFLVYQKQENENEYNILNLKNGKEMIYCSK